MKNDNLYKNYKIDFSTDYKQFKQAYCFIINKDQQIRLNQNNTINIEKTDTLNDKYNPNFILYFGEYKNKPALIINTDKKLDNYMDLIKIYDLNQELYPVASRAKLVNNWYMTNQYCGRCGTKTKVDKKDMMMLCPNCRQMHYSRIAPAIIVAINNNGKLLMAKHSYHTKKDYALIAGFVEAGETIEEAVKREVKEEVNLEIENIKYITSQSWPYPNSLMLGFSADYKSGEIKTDEDEILEARWFKPDEIKTPESDVSISAYLIKKFIQENK